MTEKKKRGRKNKYFTHVEPRLKEIEQWCGEGLTEKEMCEKLGVGWSTWNEYKIEFVDLVDTLKRGKIVADQKVVASLYRRAIGYEYTEVKKKAVVDVLNPSEIKLVTESETTKHVVPDVTAQIFWLKNRLPADWRDVKDQKYTGDITIEIIDRFGKPAPAPGVELDSSGRAKNAAG